MVSEDDKIQDWAAGVETEVFAFDEIFNFSSWNVAWVVQVGDEIAEENGRIRSEEIQDRRLSL